MRLAGRAQWYGKVSALILEISREDGRYGRMRQSRDAHQTALILVWPFALPF